MEDVGGQAHDKESKKLTLFEEKKKHFCFLYQLGISMNDHILAFDKIIVDLLNLDENIKDGKKTLLLLNLFPMS